MLCSFASVAVNPTANPLVAPTGGSAFCCKQRSYSIRPNGHRTVEALFLPHFGLESRLFLTVSCHCFQLGHFCGFCTEIQLHRSENIAYFCRRINCELVHLDKRLGMNTSLFSVTLSLLRECHVSSQSLPRLGLNYSALSGCFMASLTSPLLICVPLR